MNFLDDIISLGGKFLSGIGGSLVKVAALGYLSNLLNKSINPSASSSNSTVEYIPSAQMRLQNNSSPDNKVPVVYGSAILSGIITDAALTNNDKTMSFCFTICEKTGIKLSNGQNSNFSFLNIYWDDCLLTFQSDGITVSSKIDRDGNPDTSIDGLIKVYCFNGNSTSPVVPAGGINNNLQYAYNIFPGWTTSHVMSDLIFAIVTVQYDAPKGLTKLGTVKFHVENSMSEIGDCLYDYMTSTRYGASLLPSEINI